MAKLKERIGNYGIYELDEIECKIHSRLYPTFAVWDLSYTEGVGNMSFTEDEESTLENAVQWCKEVSQC